MSSKEKMIAAALAGILGAATAQATEKTKSDMNMKMGDGADVKCMGLNSCSGKGACASKFNSCAGKNSCTGKGVTFKKSEKECTAAGGKVEAKNETKDEPKKKKQ